MVSLLSFQFMVLVIIVSWTALDHGALVSCLVSSSACSVVRFNTAAIKRLCLVRRMPLLLSSSWMMTKKETQNWVDNEDEGEKGETTSVLGARKNAVLSNDPLIYTIHNLLTKEECRKVQTYVQNLCKNEQEGTTATGHTSRTLTISNPPEISLNAAKLWPLPLLSLLAGLPPIFLLLQQKNQSTVMSSTLGLEDVIQAALPNVVGALVGSLALAYGVVLPLIRHTSKSTCRTSVSLALNEPSDFDLIRPLVDRIVSVTGHAWQLWEAPVVTRYDPGAIFARHGDASPTRGSEWRDLGGQRVITCIVYLNTLLQEEKVGGETYFDQLKIRVAPEQGKALVFHPANANTWVADDRTTHESLPPMREKWILQMFGRAERVPPPLGLPDSYGIATNDS